MPKSTLFSSNRFRSRPCMVVKDNRDDEVAISQNSSAASEYGAVDGPNAEPQQGHSQAHSSLSSTDEPQQLTGNTINPRFAIAGGLLFTVVAGVGIAAGTGVLSPETFVSVAAWFETLGPSAIFLYAALYFVLELVAVPALPLTLGSGYLFGLINGTVAVSIASTAAAAAAFLIARYGLRESVANLASRYPRFRAMDRAIGKEGFKFVFLLRLSPLLPFSISNYLYGLTSVDFAPYVVGSWIGMLPGTLAYVSAGAAVSALTDINSGKDSVNPIIVVIGVVATIAVLATLGKIATQAINSVDEEEIAQNS